MAGWIGSTNLGDELVFAGLRRRLAAAGARVAAISLDPAATRTAHGVGAVAHTDLPGLWRAVGTADALVLGGGGLLQDETSLANLPYHLSRPLLARLRATPWAAVGVGVGPLGSGLARRLAGSLGRAVAVSVRDRPSAALLSSVGVAGVRLAADTALNLPAPAACPADRIVACLRPWGRTGRLPVTGGRLAASTPDWFTVGAAAALDAASTTTGLEVRLVALDGDRDARLHTEVAGMMRAPVSCAAPDRDGLLEEVAASRVVVGMRYHAGIAAALAGRPCVLLAYSPKVGALAADLGGGARWRTWSPQGVAGLPTAVRKMVDRDGDMAEAATRLRQREEVNGRVVERLLGG